MSMYIAKIISGICYVYAYIEERIFKSSRQVWIYLCIFSFQTQNKAEGETVSYRIVDGEY